MSDDHKQPFWPWIVALLIGLPITYALSFGPACWMNCRTGWVGRESLSNLYRPIIRLAEENRNDTVSTVILWWASAGADEGTVAFVLNDYIEWGSELPGT